MQLGRSNRRSEEHTSELQSHHLVPTRRSSDLIPQNRVRSIEDLKQLQLSSDGPQAQLRDVADVKYGTTAAEVDRYNMQRVISLTANLHGESVGDAARQIQQEIGRAHV